MIYREKIMKIKQQRKQGKRKFPKPGNKCDDKHWKGYNKKYCKG